MGYWVSPELDALAAVFGYGLMLYLFWQFGIKNLFGLHKVEPDWSKKYHQLLLKVEERNRQADGL